MAKDYAKRVLTTYKKTKKKKLRIEFILIPIFLIALIGYWSFANRSTISSKIRGLAFLQHKSVAKRNSSQSSMNSKNNDAPEMDIHFDFYNQLPSQQVPIREEVLNDSLKESNTFIQPKIAKSESSKSGYLLLFGQYKNPSEAGQMRVSLLLAECEAEMVEIQTSQGKLFQVQKGPFLNLVEAKEFQNQLEKKGISSDLKKI